MKLANETVVATCLSAGSAFCSICFRNGRRTIAWNEDSSMLVRGFDRGSIQNKECQQQTNGPGYRRGFVVESTGTHAGRCQN